METVLFGISVTQKEELEALRKTPLFAVAEISGELLDSGGEFLRSAADQLSLSVSEAIPRKILEAIPETPAAVREEILLLFARRCEVMARCGITRAALAPDLLRLLQEPAFFAASSHFLRGCFGIAERNRVRLSFELRVPGALAEKSVQFLRLKERFLYPLGTVLDFHPHEPEALLSLSGALKALPFESGCWRLSFDAASGNCPGTELLRRILPRIKALPGESPLLFFAPGQGGNGEELFLLLQEICRALLTPQKEEANNEPGK